MHQTFLKFTHASIQDSYISVLTAGFKVTSFPFKILLFLFLKVLLVSRLTVFILSPFIELGFYIHYNSGLFLLSKNIKHSSSNPGFISVFYIEIA